MNLEILNSVIGDWLDRDDAIYKKYIKNKKTPHYKKMSVYRLLADIENHRFTLLYRNYIEVSVKAYFQDNYINLTTDYLESINVLTLPFFESLDIIKDTYYTSIAEVYKEYKSGYSYDYNSRLKNDILQSWHEVCNEIESQTLNLFCA